MGQLIPLATFIDIPPLLVEFGAAVQTKSSDKKRNRELQLTNQADTDGKSDVGSMDYVGQMDKEGKPSDHTADASNVAAFLLINLFATCLSTLFCATISHFFTAAGL